MLRNVYDFDNTIYAGDSTVDFYCYCCLRHPKLLLDLPAVALMGLGLATGSVDKTRAKQRIYRFLKLLPDVQAEVASFWQTHQKNIKAWYLAQKSPDDVVISASPTFLLTPVCKALGVTLFASRVDKNSGVYTGKNCHGEEKVLRLIAAMPDCEINRFYSDSFSDAPLARLAKSAYLVKGTRIMDWPKGRL